MQRAIDEMPTCLPKLLPEGNQLNLDNDETDEKDEKKEDVLNKDEIIAIKKSNYFYVLEASKRGKNSNRPVIKSVVKSHINLNPYKLIKNPKPVSKMPQKNIVTVEESLEKQENINTALSNQIDNSFSVLAQLLKEVKKLSEKVKANDNKVKSILLGRHGESTDGPKDVHQKVRSNFEIKDKSVENGKDDNLKLQNKDSKNFAKDIKESLKIGFMNKSGNIRREYKSDKETKFEFFYDYLSSELTSYELLHI